MTLASIKTKQLLLAFFLIVFIIWFILIFAEKPFFFPVNQKSKEKRAAIAIRDNVIPFQKMGTKLFTFPYLTKFYDTLYYFTQYAEDDKKYKFIKDLNYILDHYSTVDVFLLAHSNNFIDWVKEIDKNKISKIRLVYNTGCSGVNQSSQWKNIGVKTYVSHIGNNSVSPVFYFYFLRRWCKGWKLNKAVYNSNLEMRTKLIQFNKLGWSTCNTDLVRNSLAIITGDSLLTIDSVYENIKK
jgi:hypothetical protein